MGAQPHPVRVAQDRSLRVEPGQIVRTGWIDIGCCQPARRGHLSLEAVREKYQVLVNLGHARPWPPMVGRWDGDTFVIHDGHHQLQAEQIIGSERVFVAWLEAETGASSGARQ